MASGARAGWRTAPAAASSRTTSALGRALAVLLAACLVLAPVSASLGADAPLTREFDRADFLLSDSPTPPDATAPWQALALPDLWERSRPGVFGTAWYRVRMNLEQAPTEPWLVYFPRLRDGGELYVNGSLAASIRQSDERHFVQWVRPHAPSIPPGMLTAGDNELHLRVSVQERSHRMMPFFAGPESELRRPYQWRLFWSYTSAQMTVIATISLGLFVLAIWIRRRMAFDYGLFGLACVCWGVRTMIIVFSVYPRAIWPWWNVVYYASTGGFVVCMTLFMLRFAGLRSPVVERITLAYWLTGPLLLAMGGQPWDHIVGRVYQGGLIVVSAVMLTATAIVGWRKRTPGVLLLCAGVVFGLTLGVHDYLVLVGVFDYRHPYVLHLSAIVLLGAVAGLLADGFVRSLHEAEQAARVLESTVRARETELARNYERLRRLERERVLSEERQRIMQDMHDGLGSQLLSSLAMVERGALDRDTMAQALREAIDDMRLAIDTLAPGREGLIEALANLAWRLQPRFRAAGIALHFHLDRAPDRVDLPAEDALQVLRILQEALANTLKHSGARTVDVFLAVDDAPLRLTLTVRDDGSGFDTERPSGGRGLAGMQRRARQLGTELTVHSDAQGSQLSIEVPLRVQGNAQDFA
ncbi:MAG TPA: sensor histidine kinase [Zeimonas sp.]|nr:sensor histidine kinase [Zeimonas sp.]